MVNIESVKKFNSRLNEHKGKINNLRVRVEMQEAEIERKLSELSTMLGTTVTVDNVEQLYQSLSADIENQLENGNAILDRIEERAQGNGASAQNVAAVTQAPLQSSGMTNNAYANNGAYAPQSASPAFGSFGASQQVQQNALNGVAAMGVGGNAQPQVQPQVQQVQPQVQQVPSGVFGAFGGMGGFGNTGAVQQQPVVNPLQNGGNMNGFGVIPGSIPSGNATNGVLGV